MDLLVAALLLIFLLAFFAVAIWVSYLVVFRGWRITGPPPAPTNNPRKDEPPPPRSRRSGRR